MTTYKVLGKKILVQRDPVKEPGENSLFVPDDVQRPPRTGVVIAVGDEQTKVFVKDKVAFHEYAGYLLEVLQDLSQSDLIVLRDEEEVLAVLSSTTPT